ncbi:gamma-glutamylcyclotransferase [Streptomyces sp. ID01-12c]|uniref:gamma-glutamylcyclotransferase family protein n=1 Tax=Streptomyces caniscabiei TaxID=2746961 RepID=UPI0017801C96|nr:gamma-glutamylcyclotransferase family protein [Streptomyces caniscabiei]MBD9701413.1 gamma-glutamylcyclotransferase [Streptomyces caniscabiei]MDX3725551.1 gamma-glutamylcyclotransferase [Streptomyces caniscabiei]
MLPFFVYGTLRPGEPNHDLCLRGRTVAEEPARMRGMALYDGPGYPYAVESLGDGVGDRAGDGAGQGRGGAGEVSGEIVTAAPEEYAELLRTLDQLEEYAPGDPANLYERVERSATLADGTVVRAWVYVAAPTVAAGLRARGKPIESGDWRLRG